MNKPLFYIKRFYVWYQLNRNRWAGRLVRFPVYLLIAYLIWAFVLASMISRALVLEVVLALMPKTKLDGVNILVVGVDGTNGIQRSDTIMVLHLDSSKNRVGVMSIPRDTRVNVAGIGPTKINHAYAFGGISLLKRTVMEFMNIPIDRYIRVNLTGVQHLVDQLGGVVVTVPKNMYYVDAAGDLYIELKKGKQVLNGDKSVQYLRFRHDQDSDLGRIHRQQGFVHSVANRIVELGDDADLPRIVTKLSQSFDSDLSTKELTGMVVQFRDALHTERIDMGTIPGSAILMEGVSFWKPDISQMDQSVDRVLLGLDVKQDLLMAKVKTADRSASTDERRTVTLKEANRVAQQTDLAVIKSKKAKDKVKVIKKQMVVEVLNGTGIPGQANQAAATLKKLGFKVSRTGNAGSFKYGNTLLVDWRNQVDSSVAMAHALGVDPSKIIVYNRPKKTIDATIVVGKDWGQLPRKAGVTP